MAAPSLPSIIEAQRRRRTMPNLPLAVTLHATDICHLQKGPVDLRWMDGWMAGWVDGVGRSHGCGCEPVADLAGSQGASWLVLLVLLLASLSNLARL